jgi:acyl-coenzyme A synthetase/AMP-(fatty) acid ligase/D-alanine-D-alanine ligase-like ATP-grasp enzyme
MVIDNLSDILTHQAKQQPNKIAVFSNDKSYTYKELDILVSKLATYLHQKGVKQKDICLHYFEDEFLLIIAMLALARLGATLISTTSKPNVQKIQELKKIVDIKWIVDSSFVQFENFIHIETLENFSSAKNTTWQIVIGSGTTGKEKLFEVSYELEFQRIKISKSSITLSSNDIVVSVIPLQFNSTKIRFLATLYVGASYYLLDKEISNFSKTLQKNRITVLYSTVYYTELILISLFKKEKNNFDFLRVLSIGGSTVSEELKYKVKEKLTSNLYIGYGTNDIGGITCTLPETIFTTPQTVGKVLENISVEIVDNKDKKIKDGQIGNIRVKSPGMIKNYLKDKENTQKFFKDGWFYPGDLGKFTQTKELIYLGRADHMMILNGINIYPAIIENRLLEHKDVQDVVCIPLKDSINQDIPISAVVLKDFSSITKENLINFCYEKLGSASTKDIVVLKQIPRNNLGKVQREKLLEKIYQKLLFSDTKLSQTTKKFTLQVNKKEIHNIKKINLWFEKIFDIELQNNKIENDIHTLSYKALYLIRKLLQICKIPNFYLGSVESIIEKNDSYTIDFKLPYIEFIPTEYYTNILNNSFTFLYLMMDNEPTQENQNFFISKYLKNLISPVLQNNPQGKSQFKILKKAYENDIPFIHLGNGIFQLGWGNNSKKIDRSTTQNDSAIGLKLSSNKLSTANLLKQAGLPAPLHGFSNNIQEALHIANNIKYPIVIKPLDLGRGEGVSVNINDENKLQIAFEKAYLLSPNKKVLIEKQVKGVCYRVFIAHGKFLYAVKRLPIGIYADGKMSIETLINNANQREQEKFFWEKKDTYFKDALAINVMKTLGYTLKSIPSKDTFIPLREIESTKDGGIDEDVTSLIHKQNIDIALKATKLLELSVAGVDIITEDISKPWYETDAIINELNYAPLLGGGEISKSNIDQYLENLIEKNGRVPIEIFLGEKQKAMKEALKKQKEYIDKDVSCYFTSDTTTYDNNKKQIHFKNSNLIARCEALFLNSSVEALIIVDDANFFYKEYCPFDKVTKINIV